jgi:nucleotide-binding universal stress UspA family protein
VALLSRAGVQAEARLIAGDPKRVLLDHAKDWPADTIFVGAQGMRALERFFLGSVSSAIASRASCSVEVVRG